MTTKAQTLTSVRKALATSSFALIRNGFAGQPLQRELAAVSKKR